MSNGLQQYRIVATCLREIVPAFQVTATNPFAAVAFAEERLRQKGVKPLAITAAPILAPGER